MHIHITGMSPREVSPRFQGRDNLAATLEIALRAQDHQVRRAPEASGTPEVVFVGVTSPLSPAASYSFFALRAIGDALNRGTPMVFVVDDPDLNKIQAGARSAQRDISRLYTPYMMSKRIKRTAFTPVGKTRISAAIELLASDNWPVTVLPMHPWGNERSLGRVLGVNSDVVYLDPSGWLTQGNATSDVSPASMWFTDSRYSTDVLDPERVRWPVVPVNTRDIDEPIDVYLAARGIYQGKVGRSSHVLGWWTPTPHYVAAAKTVYVTDGDENSLIGGPYYLTPDDVEELSPHQHADLAAEQAAYLKEKSWDREMLSSRLADVIGLASSSVTRAGGPTRTESSSGSPTESLTPSSRSKASPTTTSTKRSRSSPN
jgi:hypothetical protein